MPLSILQPHTCYGRSIHPQVKHGEWCVGAARGSQVASLAPAWRRRHARAAMHPTHLPARHERLSPA